MGSYPDHRGHCACLASSWKATCWRRISSVTVSGCNPVWLMFALFAFGYLFGFVGLLLAVPLAAATAVLIRFALRRYRRARSTPEANRRERRGLASDMPSGAGSSSASLRPRQLALALDHAESYAREDFLSGSLQRGRAARWSTLGRTGRRAPSRWSGRKDRARRIWRRSGRRWRARASSPRALSPRPTFPPRSRPARWSVEDAGRDGGRAGAVPPASTLPARRTPFCSFTARTAPSIWPVTIPDLMSRLRALPVVTLAGAGRCDVARGHRETRRRSSACRSKRASSAISRRISSAHSRRRARPSLRLDKEALRQGRPPSRALAAEMFRDAV